MSFLFLMIKIALVIYALKFVLGVVVWLLWFKFANNSEAQAVIEATVKEVK